MRTSSVPSDVKLKFSYRTMIPSVSVDAVTHPSWTVLYLCNLWIWVVSLNGLREYDRYTKLPSEVSPRVHAVFPYSNEAAFITHISSLRNKLTVRDSPEQLLQQTMLPPGSCPLSRRPIWPRLYLSRDSKDEISWGISKVMHPSTSRYWRLLRRKLLLQLGENTWLVFCIRPEWVVRLPTQRVLWEQSNRSDLRNWSSAFYRRVFPSRQGARFSLVDFCVSNYYLIVVCD